MLTNSLIKELKLEVERLKAENKFKNGLISILSHDSKEIFGSSLWLIESLEENRISQEDFFKMLPQIKRDAKKNLQTVQNSTEWLKTQYGKFEIKVAEIKILDLFQNLKDKYADQLQKKNITFHFKGDLNQIVKTDLLLLEYVLDQLLNNAIKYSSRDQDVHLQCSTEENQTIISIIDHGIGIGENNLSSIFSFDNPVFEGTDGERGAGLSLKIVHNFVSLMHGSMKIVSSEDRGTIASVFLPQI